MCYFWWAFKKKKIYIYIYISMVRLCGLMLLGVLCRTCGEREIEY